MNKKHILPGDEIKDKNFNALFKRITSSFSSLEALRMKDEATGVYKTWTFYDMKSEVYALGGWLKENGAVFGSKVGLYSENRPEWCIGYFAIVISGITVVPIDSMCAPSEAEHIIKDSEISLLLISERMQDKIEHILPECKSLKAILNFDIHSDSSKKHFSYKKHLQRTYDTAFIDDLDIDPHHLASLIYTSGTTGLSKGVMLSHRNIISNINAAVHAFYVYPTDVFVTVLPLHHAYACSHSFLSAVTMGASTTISESLVGKKIVDNIRETSGSLILGVPLLFEKMVQGMKGRFKEQPIVKRLMINVFMAIAYPFTVYFNIKIGKLLFKSLRKKAGLTTLRLMICGGGPLRVDTSRFFECLGFDFIQGYGLTETSPLLTVNTIEYRDNRSVGLPILGVDIKILDPNNDGVGEIAAKGDMVMLGYYKNPEATKAVILDDGYFRTGDVGYIDSRGFVFITGRNKNILVTGGGKNIYPEEIEIQLDTSPFILESLVVGKLESANSKGESAFAFIVPDYEYFSSQFAESMITDDFVNSTIDGEVKTINTKLADYKKVKGFKIRKEEFEKTSTRKIKRYLYKDLLR